MPNVRKTSPEPTLAQVRDYVLSMLEGLSSLAETVDDLHTRDHMRGFANELLMSWSTRPGAIGLASAADGPRGQGSEGWGEGAAGDRLILREQP